MTIDLICIIGPTSNNKETLAQLIKNGIKIVPYISLVYKVEFIDHPKKGNVNSHP